MHAFDAREGGGFAITLTYDGDTGAGKTTASSDSFSGRFVSLLPDTEVVQAVAFETDDPDVRGDLTITCRLEDAPDGGTLVTGLHQDLPPGVSAADDELGWTTSLRKLAELVEQD